MGNSVLLQTFTLTSLILYLKLTASPSEFSEDEKVVNWGNDYSSLHRLAAEFQPCFCISAGTSWLSSPSHTWLSSAPAHSHLTPMLTETEMASEKPNCLCKFSEESCSLFSSCHMEFALGDVRLLCKSLSNAASPLGHLTTQTRLQRLIVKLYVIFWKNSSWAPTPAEHYMEAAQSPSQTSETPLLEGKEVT